MSNTDIRSYAQTKGVRLWQIASKLGMNDGNFSRKLRFELTDEKKREIRLIIDELAAEQDGDGMDGRIKIEDAARFLRMDSQTLRLMIQNNLIPGATCFKRGTSRRYTYLILAKPFSEATGGVAHD